MRKYLGHDTVQQSVHIEHHCLWFSILIVLLSIRKRVVQLNDKHWKRYDMIMCQWRYFRYIPYRFQLRFFYWCVYFFLKSSNVLHKWFGTDIVYYVIIHRAVMTVKKVVETINLGICTIWDQTNLQSFKILLYALTSEFKLHLFYFEFSNIIYNAIISFKNPTHWIKEAKLAAHLSIALSVS